MIVFTQKKFSINKFGNFLDISFEQIAINPIYITKFYNYCGLGVISLSRIMVL